MGKEKPHRPREVELWVDPTDSVKNVKETLKLMLGVDVNRQRLIFQGQQLNNSDGLVDKLKQASTTDDLAFHLVCLDYNIKSRSQTEQE